MSGLGEEVRESSNDTNNENFSVLSVISVAKRF
jgi:hypothetical protein